MALITCPECDAQVSSAAASCPKCGHPIAQSVGTTGRFAAAASAAGVDLSDIKATSQTPSQPRQLSDSQLSLLLSQKKTTNHLLHLVISFFLCGMWLPVWLFVALSNNAHNKRIDRRLAGGPW